MSKQALHDELRLCQNQVGYWEAQAKAYVGTLQTERLELEQVRAFLEQNHVRSEEILQTTLELAQQKAIVGQLTTQVESLTSCLQQAKEKKEVAVQKLWLSQGECSALTMECGLAKKAHDMVIHECQLLVEKEKTQCVLLQKQVDDLKTRNKDLETDVTNANLDLANVGYPRT